MSNHEANKVIRVLKGERMKYTIMVHKPDGSVVEWQAAKKVKMEYLSELREPWIVEGEYSGHPIMRYQEGMIILCEENPDYVEPKKP